MVSLKYEKICIFLFCLVYSTPILAQKLQFKVIGKGDSDGYAKLPNQTRLGLKSTKLKAKVTFWLFSNREIDTFTEVLIKTSDLPGSKYSSSDLRIKPAR